MLGFRKKLVTLARSCSIVAVGLAVPFTISAVPAQAEGLFGFLKLFSPPPAPAPVYQPYQFAPEPERPRIRSRPKPAPVAETEVKKPVKPRTPGEMDNPVPALLADSTLRPGDMVMFPDGLRVFTGQTGGPHKLADFKPLSKAGNAVSRETRKLVARLIPSENPAWNTAALKSGNKLAANTKDVETTGSVRQPRR